MEPSFPCSFAKYFSVQEVFKYHNTDASGQGGEGKETGKRKKENLHISMHVRPISIIFNLSLHKHNIYKPLQNVLYNRLARN